MGPLFFAVGALALVAFLQFSLFIVSKRRLDHLIASQKRNFEEWHAKEENLTAEIAQIKGEIGDLRSCQAMAPPPGQSMNLSRRNQVLRMHFRGDSPSRIATVLQISRGEVDLLLKVQRTVIPSQVWAPSGKQEPGKTTASIPDFKRLPDEIESRQTLPDASTDSGASLENQEALQ
jgi:hypothetical protein